VIVSLEDLAPCCSTISARCRDLRRPRGTEDRTGRYWATPCLEPSRRGACCSAAFVEGYSWRCCVAHPALVGDGPYHPHCLKAAAAILAPSSSFDARRSLQAGIACHATARTYTASGDPALGHRVPTSQRYRSAGHSRRLQTIFRSDIACPRLTSAIRIAREVVCAKKLQVLSDSGTYPFRSRSLTFGRVIQM
jgi:hypothetical protein